MKKILLAATALIIGLSATVASASVLVLGSSPARTCYESARDRNGTPAALQDCDAALHAGGLTRHDQIATHVNRGIVRIVGGDIQGAIADYDQAIALDAREAEAYLNKGAAYLKLDRHSDALTLFQTAIDLNTERPELAYFGRAVAHESTGNVREAYLDYKRAQAAAPKWRDPARELTRFQVRPAGGTRL
jgi:tetratricopeptide (TPR) repeat protein